MRRTTRKTDTNVSSAAPNQAQSNVTDSDQEASFFTTEKAKVKQPQAIIKVVGVGGAGGNAVNRMIEAKIENVEFLVMNTDVQALDRSLAEIRIALGAESTRGLGAGGNPEVGTKAAQDSKNEIRKHLEGADMVFITAGMGGGTGTGAAPVVAEIARELGALTVSIVTRPFSFEGPKRRRIAITGYEALSGKVDSVIAIPNDRILEVVERKSSFDEALRQADEVLRQGVQGICEIITTTGEINLDFADVRTVMKDRGTALMGIGVGVGSERAVQAAQQAINSKLLEQDIRGAKGVLVNIKGSPDVPISEIYAAMTYIEEQCDQEDCEVFFGYVADDKMKDEIHVTVVATGFEEVATTAGVGLRSFSSFAKEEVEPEARPATRPVTTQREKVVFDPNDHNVQDLAKKSRGAEGGDIDSVFSDEDFDIPSFIREHRKKKE
jgi:cell division protein FtsZ